jgi:hypothetical protein
MRKSFGSSIRRCLHRHDLLSGIGSGAQREKPLGLGLRDKRLVVLVNHIGRVTWLIGRADGITC